jgi:leader peptidase (prepilin peptidase) / N-methyltransferase
MEQAGLALTATLSAPFCASLAVGAANRAPVSGSHPVSPVIVLAIAFLSGLVVATAPNARAAWETLALTAALGYLAAYDLRALAIPVVPTVVAIGAGLGLGFLDASLFERVIAAALGAGAFVALDHIYHAVRSRSGLGLGDALIAALIGAWSGLGGLVWSVAIGGVVALLWIAATRHAANNPLPFVPALGVGVALYFMARSLAL